MAFYREWIGQFNKFNKNIKLSIWSTILLQIGLGIFMVIYNFYIRELGFSERTNGQVIAMTSLATAMILIPAGLLSDRYGRKNILLLGIGSSGVVLFFRSIIELETLLMTGAFLTGLTIAFVQVASIPWLAENSKPDQRVHLFSIHFAVMTGANVIGNLVGGVMTDLLSIYFPILLSLRLTLLFGSVLFLAGVIPVFRFKEVKSKTSPENIEKEKTPAKRELIEDKRGIKIIILFAIAQLIIGIGSGLVIPYLNLYFADRFHASNSAIGFIISLGQAATAFAMIIGPAVVRKFGEVKAVVILQLLSLPFLLLTAFTQQLWLAAIGFLFRQALMNAGNPIQMSLMMSKVDDSMKGLANSINQMVFNIGWAVMGPISTGIVIKYGAYWGYALVFSVTASLYFIASIYFFVVFKKLSPSHPSSSFEKATS